MKLLILLLGFTNNIGAMETIKSCFEIEGMKCHSCQEKISTQLGLQKAIKKVDISVQEASGTITYLPLKMDDRKIIKIIKKAGYQATKKECKN